jgi:hypothetical protein
MELPTRLVLPDPIALVASLMSMMTRFSCLGCPRIAGRIRHDLSVLQRYPDDAMPPLLKQWAQLQSAISDTPEHAEHDPCTASQSLH